MVQAGCGRARIVSSGPTDCLPRSSRFSDHNQNAGTVLLLRAYACSLVSTHAWLRGITHSAGHLSIMASGGTRSLRPVDWAGFVNPACSVSCVPSQCNVYMHVAAAIGIVCVQGCPAQPIELPTLLGKPLLLLVTLAAQHWLASALCRSFSARPALVCAQLVAESPRGS